MKRGLAVAFFWVLFLGLVLAAQGPGTIHLHNPATTVTVMWHTGLDIYDTAADFRGCHEERLPFPREQARVAAIDDQTHDRERGCSVLRPPHRHPLHDLGRNNSSAAANLRMRIGGPGREDLPRRGEDFGGNTWGQCSFTVQDR